MFKTAYDTFVGMVKHTKECSSHRIHAVEIRVVLAWLSVNREQSLP
jgi:hypothetical protein